MRSSFGVFIVFLFIAGCVGRFCPVRYPCFCEEVPNVFTRGKRDYVANCRAKNLYKIPMFYGNTKVDRLDLSRNEITRIGRNELKNIRPTEIRFYSNKISVVDDLAFAEVKDYVEFLDLTFSMELSAVPTEALGYLQNLKTLRISVSKLEVLPSTAFPRLRSLNRLEFVGYGMRRVEENAFDELAESLVHLDLGISGFDVNNMDIMNPFPLAIRSLRNLQSLVMTYCRIDAIPENAFLGMTSLKYLVLDGNHFNKPGSMNKKSFNGLQNSLLSLTMNNAKLTGVPNDSIRGLRKLCKLRMEKNLFTNITQNDFIGLESLKELYLEQKPMFYFDSASFTHVQDRLEILSISQSGLKQVPTEKLTNLRALTHLNLPGNDIFVLPTRALSGINALNYDFSRNKIKQIDQNVFHLKDIVAYGPKITLNVMDNDLKNVDFIDNPCMFSQVNIQGNPIECDCHLFSIVRGIATPNVVGKCKEPGIKSNLQIGSSVFISNMTDYCANMNIQKVDCSTPTVGVSYGSSSANTIAKKVECKSPADCALIQHMAMSMLLDLIAFLII